LLKTALSKIPILVLIYMRTVVRHLSQTHASRKSLTVFHWLTSAGFKLEQLVSLPNAMESLHAKGKELLIVAFLSNSC